MPLTETERLESALAVCLTLSFEMDGALKELGSSFSAMNSRELGATIQNLADAMQRYSQDNTAESAAFTVGSLVMTHTMISTLRTRLNRIKRRVEKLSEWTYGKQVNETARRFQEYIRLRDAVEAGNGGRLRCCYCRRWVMWNNDADACHFHSRSNRSTIFDEMNCHGGHKGCNQRGSQVDYAVFMAERYTKQELDDLNLRSNTPRDRFTKTELAEMYIGWGDKITALKKTLAD